MRARLFIALRKHAGLTHEEVGARAGVSPSTVRTHEAASRRSGLDEFFRICHLGLGFDSVLVLFETSRRLYEAGTLLAGDRKPQSEATVIKDRCEIKDGLTPAEARRQLRVMKALTLPSRPGPPARKRKVRRPVP